MSNPAQLRAFASKSRSGLSSLIAYDVLSYLAAGMTPQDILHDFPYLTAEDIQACLSYAADRERHLLVAHA
nr:DUF433 domain-containing protein [Candidatus Chloroploca asiatica]